MMTVAITPAQIRGARAMLAMSADRLAKLARVHRRTIRAVERGDVEPQRGTAERIAKALESAGIEFLGDEGVRRKCQSGISENRV
jgi:DNA-binding XRE family transcriptional regulator